MLVIYKVMCIMYIMEHLNQEINIGMASHCFIVVKALKICLDSNFQVFTILNYTYLILQ